VGIVVASRSRTVGRRNCGSGEVPLASLVMAFLVAEMPVFSAPSVIAPSLFFLAFVALCVYQSRSSKVHFHDSIIPLFLCSL